MPFNNEQLPIIVGRPGEGDNYTIRRLQEIAGRMGQETWNFANAYIKAGIDPYTVLSLILTISAGYPTTFPLIAKNSIRYLTPLLAVLGIIRQFMKQQDIRQGLALQNISEGVASGISTTAFLSQVTFFAVTDIIRFAEHDPKNSPIYISNPAAWSIILSLLGAALLLDGGRTYIETKRARLHGSQLNVEEMRDFINGLNRFEKILLRTSCNPVVRYGLSYIVPASITHTLISGAQKLVGVDNQHGEILFRRIATIGSGFIYAPVLGMQYPEHSKAAAFLKGTLELSMFFSLAFAFGLLFADPNAKEDLGEGTVAEQILLYTLFVPLLDALLQLSRCIPWRTTTQAIAENHSMNTNFTEMIPSNNRRNSDSGSSMDRDSIQSVYSEVETVSPVNSDSESSNEELELLPQRSVSPTINNNSWNKQEVISFAQNTQRELFRKPRNNSELTIMIEPSIEFR